MVFNYITFKHMKENIMNITIEKIENDFLTEYDKKDIMNYIEQAFENRKNINSKVKHKSSAIGFDSFKITSHLLEKYGDNKAIKAFIKYYIFKIMGNSIESKKQYIIYKTYVLSKITKYTYRNDEIKLNNHKAFKLFLNEIEEYYCLPSIHPSFKSKLINVYFNCFYDGFDNNPNFLNLYE